MRIETLRGWLVAAALAAGCSSGALGNPVPGGGAGSGGHSGDASVDGAACPGSTSYDCIGGCSSDYLQARVCVGGAWNCPIGTFAVSTCAETCRGFYPTCFTATGQVVNPSCSGDSWICPAGSMVTWPADAGRDTNGDALDGGSDAEDDATDANADTGTDADDAD